MENQKFVYGTAQALSENKFTKENYRLKEWNTKADGTGTSYSNKQIVNNLTRVDGGTVRLYAIYELDMYTYQITTDQIDAKINVTVNGVTTTYIGNCILNYLKGTNISIEITKYGYKTINATDTITENAVCNYTLEELSNHNLTFVANTNEAVIDVKYGDMQIASTTNGTVTFKAYDGFIYSYTATAVGYYDVSGTYTMPASNSTYNINLTEMPWITGTIANSNRTTAATKTDTNYHPGYYLIEAWGGTGSAGSGANGGSAGYVYGVVYIGYNQTIYATVGGNGDKNNGSSGGANGGGTSGTDDVTDPGSGGGYSAFAVGTSSMTLENVQNSSIKLIAGGSGGGSGKSGTMGLQNAAGTGGNGGTLSSTSTAVTGGTAFSGTAGTYGKSKGGGGAGYTSGGTSEKGDAGGFLLGGNAHARGGGGGAGYYGGGGGSGYNSNALSSSTNWGPGGGGGGSSFVATGVTYSGLSSSVTSKLVGSNPSSTGGAVIITYIGKSL